MGDVSPWFFLWWCGLESLGEDVGEFLGDPLGFVLLGEEFFHAVFEWDEEFDVEGGVVAP